MSAWHKDKEARHRGAHRPEKRRRVGSEVSIHDIQKACQSCALRSIELGSFYIMTQPLGLERRLYCCKNNSCLTGPDQRDVRQDTSHLQRHIREGRRSLPINSAVSLLADIDDGVFRRHASLNQTDCDKHRCSVG